MNTSLTSRPVKFVGDLSTLPSHGNGHRSLTWWGMMGMIAIEGTAFVLAAVAYFYMANQVNDWPPEGYLPGLIVSGWFTATIVLSAIPNLWLKRVAERELLRSVQIGMVVMSALGLLVLVIRYFEFPALNVAWSDSAYGSITVTMLGLHTVHLITDWIDTVVLTVMMFTRHAHGRRFVDVAENAIYWNFVVLAWIPIYLLLYFYPRWR